MSEKGGCSIANDGGDPKKPKPCCVCPETKKARDECVLLFGEERCGDLIEAHKRCMRQYGFELQVCQEDILKADIAIKNHIENIRHRKFTSQKELMEYTRNIKDEMAKLTHLIDTLEKFANKVNFRSDRTELLAQVKEHRNESERNRQMLRQAILLIMKAIEQQSRSFLLQGGDNPEEIELRSRKKRAENMKTETLKATESLASLVAKMSDQLKLSEDTTSTLIHSSSILRDTESEYLSMSAQIQSGGKLISKYGRRECTDKILIAFALLLYFIVILYILRKRVFSVIF